MVRNGFKIGVITADEPHEFMTYLEMGITEGLEELIDYKVQGVFETYSNHNANGEFKDALLKVISEDINALILGASFDISGYKDILDDLYINKHIPVVLMHRDFDGEIFSGIVTPDSEAMGAVAAEIAAMTQPKGAKTAVITTSDHFTPHNIAMNSFKKCCSELGA